MTTPAPSPSRTVAAFDLDGTLTRGDTLIPFLCRARGVSRTSLALVANSFLVTHALMSPTRRHDAKQALLAHLLGGQQVEALKETAEAFADHVVSRRLCSTAMERVERHRRAGHELVVVSASPELYVAPIGRRLGFAAVLATRLEVGPDGRLTGRITGPNCRGPEKVARLRDWTGDRPVALYAYGDGAGDRELLAAAGNAFRLCRGGITRRGSR